MYRSPVSQMSVPAYPTENLALEMKISDIHQILQEYEERRGSMIFAFKALLKELPDDRSVTDVLGEHELEMIDWMIAFDCDKAAGKHLRDLEIGNWKLRPHQVADLCEVETLKTPFLGNLVKLSNIKPELQDAKNFLDESNPRTREKDSRWKPKHVANAVKRSSPSKIYYRSKYEPTTRGSKLARGRSQTLPHVEFLDQASATKCKTDDSRSFLNSDGDGTSCREVITISDEESIGGNPQFVTEYHESLRAKCIQSLQPGKWLVEDVFDAILSPFIAHRENALILSPGVINVDNPIANHERRIGDLKPSHELLLLPLNIAGNHWLIALMRPKTQIVVIYDPMHVQSNFEQAELALRSFGQVGQELGPFSNWSYLRHTVRMPLLDIPP
jgi:hypothetical protein